MSLNCAKVFGFIGKFCWSLDGEGNLTGSSGSPGFTEKMAVRTYVFVSMCGDDVLCFTVTVKLRTYWAIDRSFLYHNSDCCDTGKTCLQPSLSCVLQWLLWYRKDLSIAQHVLCFTVTVVMQERPVYSPACPVFYSGCCDTGKTCLQPSMSCVLQWLLWYRKDLSIAQYVLCFTVTVVIQERPVDSQACPVF